MRSHNVSKMASNINWKLQISGCVKCFIKTKEVRIRTKHGETHTPVENELNRQVEIYLSNSRTRIKRAAARAAAEQSRNSSRDDSNSSSRDDNNNSAPLFEDSVTADWDYIIYGGQLENGYVHVYVTEIIVKLLCYIIQCI